MLIPLQAKIHAAIARTKMKNPASDYDSRLFWESLVNEITREVQLDRYEKLLSIGPFQHN